MKRLFLLVAPLGLLAAPAASAATDTSKLQEQVRVKEIVKHLKALEAIADANDGTRASGTPGFQASVNYVVPWLEDKGYAVTVQDFEFPYFEELADPELEQVSPIPQSYVDGTDFATMTYSGSGNVTANVQSVDTNVTPSATSTSGCETSDFAGFVAGRIALVQRGTCTFEVKAVNAQAAGATGVLVFNRGTPGFEGVVLGTLNQPSVNIPVLGLSFGVAQELHSPDSHVVAHIFTSTISQVRTTSNVIAETPGGDPRSRDRRGCSPRLGARGPGRGRQRVRRCDGARDRPPPQLGREHPHNRRPGRDEQGPVRVLGRRGVRPPRLALLPEPAHAGGARSDRPQPQLRHDRVVELRLFRPGRRRLDVRHGRAGPLRRGGARLPGLLRVQGPADGSKGLDARSDWQAFNELGIGFGALSTGSDQVKTPAQAALFGGTAGQIMHPCYHTACDRIDTVNLGALDVTSDAAAHATLWFAEEPAP